MAIANWVDKGVKEKAWTGSAGRDRVSCTSDIRLGKLKELAPRFAVLEEPASENAGVRSPAGPTNLPHDRISQLLSAAILLPIFWFGLELWWARQEMQAVATLQRLGASLFLTPGEGTGVRLTDPVLSDALESLIEVGDVHRLSLAGTETNDADLAVLPRLSELLVLDLQDTAVSDAGLRHVARIPRLQVLDLRDTRVTPDGIGELRSRLPDLRVRW